MNNTETLELFTQGKEAWNDWAKSKHAERQNLVEQNESGLRLSFQTYDDDVERWLEEATADFRGFTFIRHVDFEGFIFPGPADFSALSIEGSETTTPCKFEKDALFEGAQFLDVAKFDEAQFGGQALFQKTRFSKPARFAEAKFSDTAQFGMVTFFDEALFDGAKFAREVSFSDVKFAGLVTFEGAIFSDEVSFTFAVFSDMAWFHKTIFGGSAAFVEATFEKSVIFAATFRKRANFGAVRSERSFSLSNTIFEIEVPAFGSANFVQPPRLDNVKIPLHGSFPSNVDDVARYRTLRRLAAEGHDQERERVFLASETRIRRRLQESWMDGSFWLGLGYQYFSDFGRSISKPFWWWAGSIAVFALAYFILIFGGACGAGWLTGLLRASFLSSKSAVLLVSWDSIADDIDSIKKVGACLNTQTKDRVWLALLIVGLQLLQKVYSSALLFLFLLAIRNKFKIN